MLIVINKQIFGFVKIIVFYKNCIGEIQKIL
uniref:Uncharacterized protein n=1 Tax=Myoviridae sp. ctdNl2 TaxID=2825140 RepID=A0A8S5QH32_9CAUD|nr:MAG TPA: hypothetical protein [Myoviridae sp. ctdNl2]